VLALVEAGIGPVENQNGTALLGLTPPPWDRRCNNRSFEQAIVEAAI
jgi:hypothetical protein